MNTLFIQFYDPIERDSLVLYNGFTDTYNFCITKGDFLWVDVNKVDTIDLPFKKGEIFVSAFFIDHLFIVYKLAKKYPDINFICGGPVVRSFELLINKLLTSKIDVPNIILTSKTVEEYFNIPNFSQRWNLNLDGIENLHSYKYIYFSYQIDITCSWNKCIFCSYPKILKRRREFIDLSCLDEIDFNGHKQIKLTIPSLIPEYVDNVFSQLKYNDKNIYDMYVRCVPKEVQIIDNAIKKIKGDIPNFKFRHGVEWPSNKMLSFMKKGITVDNIINSINILNKYDSVNLILFMISSWPNLEPSDIQDFNKFKLGLNSKVSSATIFPLFCSIGTPAHEIYKNEIYKEIWKGPFYKGYTPKISQMVMDIDKYIVSEMKKITKKLYVSPLDYTESDYKYMVKIKELK